MCTPHSNDLTSRRLQLKDNWHLDIEAYEGLKPYICNENLMALTKVHLPQPECTAHCNDMCQHQYLDLGCGPGNFTMEQLQPMSYPDSARILAVDRSRRAVEYAKANFSDSRIAYDVFDVEHDDFVPILERYGPFDRVYSFLTFQYIGDQAKAYRNVAGLLKPGGDCVVVSLISVDAIDVWDDVYRMEEWRQMINPRELFPGMYRCGETYASSAQIYDDTRSSVLSAGLHCVSYTQYESRWKFSRIEDYLDKFMVSFNAYDGVPHEDHAAFRDLWIELMLKRTPPASGGHHDVSYTLEVVHARKPRAI